jgi:hypothetical protein
VISWNREVPVTSSFHGALGYAVELGLLPANPADWVQWREPTAAVAVNPSTVAGPAQVQAILAQVVCVRPDLVAFFGCLYYAAQRWKKPSRCTATTLSSRHVAAGR